MNHTITLTMGDWSADGHGRTDCIVISCNIDVKRLKAAYEKGSKIVGFDLTEDVASDYEDGSFPSDYAEKLQQHGLKLEEFLEEPWGKDGKEITWHVSTEGYWQVWLFIAKLGDPYLEFTEIDHHKTNINIGGYGLFNS